MVGERESARTPGPLFLVANVHVDRCLLYGRCQFLRAGASAVGYEDDRTK